MFPVLRPGQRVLLKPAVYIEIQKGDVVAFFVGPKKAVLHRVHEVQDEKLFCKGDANGFWDEPVDLAEVFGVLEMVRKSDTEWRSASAYQKKLFLKRYYNFYARLVKRVYILFTILTARMSQSFK
jgi:hypothetical protein